MTYGTKIIGFGSAFGILILILDGKTALQGAAAGIDLCIRTVIPSLFPFFLLSIGLTGSLSGVVIPVLRPLQKLFRIPPGSESILITGLLGGYPVGAQAVSGAYEKGSLTKAQADRMLTFCSNAGPAFLFGIIGPQFHGFIYPWLLWAVHLFSALAVSYVFPSADHSPAKGGQTKVLTMTDCMRKALSVMAQVCGWVVIFRVILQFTNRWILWIFPKPLQVLLTGSLELANGCCCLSQVENLGLRFVICAAMISFGGICVTMQTLSVIGQLNAGKYITGKLFQTFFSVILAFACQLTFPQEQQFPIPIGAAALGIVLMGLILICKRKNNSRNPSLLGV